MIRGAWEVLRFIVSSHSPTILPMCGIAGVVAWDDSFRIDQPVLSRMAASVAHRGPDGTDIYLNHQDEVSTGHPQCGLAFCRLSILDLDARAMQPMTDGQRRLVFNGEIFNFRELREEIDLLRPGYAWKTTGDSEVILRAFDCWGEACVEHFNGMFAFAIWNPGDGTLFLARDRMGQKPLYFSAVAGKGIAFASELNALRAVPWVTSEIDLDSVGEYLQTGYIAAPATIYRGIQKLPPASIFSIGARDSGTARVYFDANQSDGRVISSRDVKNSVIESVQRQLVSDVPIGCFLSGGVDSSIVAAAMQSVIPEDQRVLTFSIGFDDPRYDETEYAAAVAKHLGTEHRQFTVHPQAAEDLPRLAAVFGEPFGDSSALPTHYLARETRQYVKVALSGDGGDELFGGYDRYRAMRLGMFPTGASGFFRGLAKILPGSHPKSKITQARRFIASLGLPPRERYASYVALFDSELAGNLYPAGSSRHPNLVAENFERLAGGRDVVEKALAVDRITYLPEDLLTKLDRASMLHALEVRSPFMDHHLVRLAAGLKTPQLLQGGPKRMLREAFAADLPEFVFRRKKMGFAVPIGDWLRSALRPMLTDLLAARESFAAAHFQKPVLDKLMVEHQNHTHDHSQRLYALLMLELWWRGTRG